MTRDELHDKIKSLTFDYMMVMDIKKIGTVKGEKYLSTGWFDYSPENEDNIKSLVKDIPGLIVNDKLKKFRRVIKIK